MRAADCIASIERWGKRDALGQKLMEAVGAMQAVDDKTFTIKLKAPFPLILDALGKLSSNVPFMMPERLAKTDAYQQITGGDRLRPVQVRQGGMGARQQGGIRQERRLRAAQGAAELCRPAARWSRSTASSGSTSPIPRRRRRRSTPARPTGTSSRRPTSSRSSPPTRTSPSRRSTRSAIMGMLRFNHMQPPFNNPKMREAVLNLVDQKDYMGGGRRRPEILEDLRRTVRLRHAVRDQCRRRRTAERRRTSPRRSS